MLPNQSHAPTRTDLIELRKDAARVDQQIDRHKLFECRTPRLHKIVDLCSLIREVAERLCREIEDELAGVPEVIPMVPCYGDPLDTGLLYGSPEPWDEHPVAVGSCDLAIHASNWAPCDERRGA